MSTHPLFNNEIAGPPSAVGVLVIDDQVVVREGLARLIACAQIPLRCISTAATSAEALRVAELQRPEVVVLDVDLAGEDGLALIPQLASTAGVLVLTSHGDAATRARAMQLGARAFIEKHEPAAVLLKSIVEIGHLQMRGEKSPSHEGTTSLPTLAASSAVRNHWPQ
jgi:DNA-binding NarL/FixJ family response regulator